jgi:hypothetical protein
MRYFDTHLHVREPTNDAWSEFLTRVDRERDLVGANLILNTQEELDFVLPRAPELPPHIRLVPPLGSREQLPDDVRAEGWFKIHPRFHGITRAAVPGIAESLAAEPPKGVVVCCYPWADFGDPYVAVELVTVLAKRFPEMPILATHGGGYEAWALRAHTTGLLNVLYDFAVSMKYYAGSDLLRPFLEYVRYRPDQIVFGSDWPSAEAAPQLEQCCALAREVGVSPAELEELLLRNSLRVWPEIATPGGPP